MTDNEIRIYTNNLNIGRILQQRELSWIKHGTSQKLLPGFEHEGN